MRVRLSRFLNSAPSCFPLLFAQADRKTQATTSELSGSIGEVFTDIWVWLFVILLVALLGVFFYIRNRQDDD